MNQNKPPIHQSEIVLLSAIVLLALFLCLPLMNRGLYYDEVFVAIKYFQHKEFLGIFKDFWLTNHIGYTIIAYVFYYLCAGTDWSMRIPALLFGLGNIVLLWLWTREYFGRSIAFLTILFLTVSPVHTIFSTSARGYSALIFFTLLSNYLYFKLLENPSKKKFWGLISTHIIGLSFHMFFLTSLANQILHLTWITFRSKYKNSSAQTNSPAWKAIVLVLCLSMVIYVPLVMSSMRHITTYHDQLNLVFPLSLFYHLLKLILVPWGLVILVVMGLGLFWAHNKRLPGFRFYLMMLCLTPIFIWISHPPFLYPRFFIYLLPFYFLFLSISMVTMIKRTPPLWRIVPVLFVGFLLFKVAQDWRSNTQDTFLEYTGQYKEAVNYAKTIATPQTKFCAVGDFSTTFFFTYYVDNLVLLNTVDDFKKIIQEQGDIICFIGTEYPGSDDQRVLFLVLSRYAQHKEFGKIVVFSLNPSTIQ